MNCYKKETRIWLRRSSRDCLVNGGSNMRDPIYQGVRVMSEASRIWIIFFLLIAIGLGISAESRAENDQGHPVPVSAHNPLLKADPQEKSNQVITLDSAMQAGRPALSHSKQKPTTTPAAVVLAFNLSDQSQPADVSVSNENNKTRYAQPAVDRPRINTVVRIGRDTTPKRDDKRFTQNGVGAKGGMAVLKQLLKRYGKRGPIDTQAPASGAVAVARADSAQRLHETTSLYDLNRILTEQDLSTRTLEADISTVTQLAQTNDLICLLDADHYYVLIHEIDDQEVRFYHPGWGAMNGGLRSLPRHEFERQWSGRVCLIVSGRL